MLIVAIVLLSVIARKKLEQVENGGCDREGSSMGSRSSSSGTPSPSNKLNNSIGVCSGFLSARQSVCFLFIYLLKNPGLIFLV